MQFTKKYNDMGNNRKSSPRVYDDGKIFGVIGRTSDGDIYDVLVVGENPLYNPSKFGENKDSLLEKIAEAAEKSSRNVRNGFGKKQGVIVVSGGGMLITPIDGAEVVNVIEEPMQI